MNSSDYNKETDIFKDNTARRLERFQIPDMNIDLIEMIAKASGKAQPAYLEERQPSEAPPPLIIQIPATQPSHPAVPASKDTPQGSSKSIKLSRTAGSPKANQPGDAERGPNGSSRRIDDRSAKSKFERSVSFLGSDFDKEEDDIQLESDFNNQKQRPNTDDGMKDLEDENTKGEEKSSREKLKLLEQIKYEAMYSLFNEVVMDKLMRFVQKDAAANKNLDISGILLGLGDSSIPWDKVVDLKLESIRGFKALQALRLPPSILNDHTELQKMIRNRFKKIMQDEKNKKMFGSWAGGDAKDDVQSDRIAVVSSSANLPASRIADLNRRNQLVSLHEELLTQMSQSKKSLEISRTKMESLKASHHKLEEAYRIKREQLEEKILILSSNIKLVTNYQLNKHRHAEKGGPVSQELITQEQKVQDLLMQANGGKSSFLMNEDLEGAFTLLLADLRRSKFIHQKEIKELIDHKREHLGIKADYLRSLEKYVGNLEENLTKTKKRLTNMYLFLLNHPRDIALLDLTVIEVLKYLRGQKEEVREDHYSPIFDQKSIHYVLQVLENETKFNNLSKIRHSVLSGSLKNLNSKVEEPSRPKDPVRKEIEAKTSELIRSAIDTNRSRIKGQRSPRNKPAQPQVSYPAEDEFLRKDRLAGVEVLRAPEQAGDEDFFRMGGELSQANSYTMDATERQELGRSIFEVTAYLDTISTQEIQRLLGIYINKGFYPNVAEELMILLSCLFGKRAAHKAMGVYIHKKTRETFISAAEEIKKAGEEKSKHEVEDRVETIKRRVREFFVKLD